MRKMGSALPDSAHKVCPSHRPAGDLTIPPSLRIHVEYFERPLFPPANPESRSLVWKFYVFPTREGIVARARAPRRSRLNQPLEASTHLLSERSVHCKDPGDITNPKPKPLKKNSHGAEGNLKRSERSTPLLEPRNSLPGLEVLIVPNMKRICESCRGSSSP